MLKRLKLYHPLVESEGQLRCERGLTGGRVRDPAVGRQQQLQQEDHRRQQGQIRRAAVAGKKESICVTVLVCLVIAAPWSSSRKGIPIQAIHSGDNSFWLYDL